MSALLSIIFLISGMIGQNDMYFMCAGLFAIAAEISLVKDNKEN